MELLNTTWEVGLVTSLLGGTLGYLFAEWRFKKDAERYRKLREVECHDGGLVILKGFHDDNLVGKTLYLSRLDEALDGIKEK
jgi:hypothetical protein